MITPEELQKCHEAGAVALADFQGFLRGNYGDDRLNAIQARLHPITTVIFSMSEIGLSPLEAVEAVEEMLKFVRIGAELAEKES
jgi:hypothetical protein